MKTIKILPGRTIDYAYARIQHESKICGEIVCCEFNSVLMRSDESLDAFYRKYLGKSQEEHLKEVEAEVRKRIETQLEYQIDEMAERYASSIPQFEHNRLFSITDFKAGVKCGMEDCWFKIPRDRDGFAIDAYLDMMFESMPFIIADTRYNDADVVNDADWRGEIDTKPQYSHWKPIKLPKTTNNTNFKSNGKGKQSAD